MSSTAAHKRQMKLLRQIAKKAQYRTDFMVPLESEYPAVNAARLGLTDQNDKNANRLAYDFDTMCRLDLIEYRHDRTERSDYGSVRALSYGAHITDAGLEAVRQMERSWLAKAVERQPWTALNVAGSAITTIWFGVAAWFAANGYPAWLLSIFRWLREQADQLIG